MNATRAMLLAACLASTAAAAPPDVVLPPEIPWAGRSRTLAVPPGDPWATPAEQSGLTRTPSYDETLAWLRRLAAAAPELRLVSAGRSPEGRDIWMVIASRERAFTPEALRATGKPTLFAHAGIHAGEIDGKDAGLMLLRDMTVRGTRRDLLDRANLLFIPIHNVDGHERVSPFSRINQRGPESMGWRTNARNLNLNRDFAKLDAPETRAVVAVLDRWAPDLYADLHVTDGGDHQYDITFGHNAGSTWSPRLDDWLTRVLTPAVSADLAAMGHVPGPLWVANPEDPADLAKGFPRWVAGARFSTGYGDLRHVPTLLLENHSLKPYPQRVFGTYVFLESLLRLLGARAADLRAAAAADRDRRAPQVAVDFGPGPDRAAVEFRAVAQTVAPSAFSGGRRVVYSGRPETITVELRPFAPSAHAPRPAAYWVHGAWPEVIERLAAHGLRLERLDAPREVEVEAWRAVDPKLDTAPFEGRVPVSATFTVERRRERYPAGSVRVPTDQPLGDLAVVLLDPTSPDSFFRWGFFHEVLQATEYAEAYVMEPTGARLLEADPALRAEFERAVREDPALATPAARLQWLYRRTPFADARWRLLPVGREAAPVP